MSAAYHEAKKRFCTLLAPLLAQASTNDNQGFWEKHPLLTRSFYGNLNALKDIQQDPKYNTFYEALEDPDAKDALNIFFRDIQSLHLDQKDREDMRAGGIAGGIDFLIRRQAGRRQAGID